MDSYESEDFHGVFEVGRYAPERFTPDEEAAARKAGYPSAREKWVADTEYKQWVFADKSRFSRVKAQVRYDLEKVAVPPERLGALAEAARSLPGVPEYTEPEPVVPKDPVIREAARQGVRQRLVRHLTRHPELYRQWKEEGEWYPEGGDERSARYELERIEERMTAFGDDLRAVADGIEKGEIIEKDYYDAKIAPEDPELRRVHDEYEKDLKRWEEKDRE